MFPAILLRTAFPFFPAACIDLETFSQDAGEAPIAPLRCAVSSYRAGGFAAMNSITMFSGFVGPNWMGLMKDHTGSYDAGLRGLALPALLAAGTMYVLMRNLKRRPIGVGPELAEEAV